MSEFASYLTYLGPLQWFAAVVFVPLVCWQFCSEQSTFCRWCALLSGYGVQIGFFLLLDDVGIEANLLILIASVAAYFWITTTVAFWPAAKSTKPAKLRASEETNVTA